jgi:poly-gamma-glutamate synthesis protein (capsule biosynthesis protein)
MARQPHQMMQVYGLGHEDSVADVYDLHYTKKRSVPGPYWWSTVCVLEFSGWKLTSLRLHPVSVGFGLPRWQAGRPVLSAGADARQALAHLADLSRRFDTVIDIDGERGEVRLA